MTDTHESESNPVEYPDSWKNADIRRREEENDFDGPAVEAYLGSLSDIEFSKLVIRCRRGQQ